MNNRMKLSRGLDAEEVGAKFKAGATKKSLATEFGCSPHTIDRSGGTAAATWDRHDAAAGT